MNDETRTIDPFEELVATRDRLVAERDRLLARVSRVERAISSLDDTINLLNTPVDAIQIPEEEQPPRQVRRTRRGGNQERLLTILSERFPDGLNAGGINSRAKELFGEEINPNTLTVTLGRMRVKGMVRNEGRTWFFVPQNEEAAEMPTKAPPAASLFSDQGGPSWNRLSDDTNPPPGEREI